MRIQELRLEGFRVFENARLSLDDLTVLVGRNGAGKSTIIDAFEFLREALTDSLENALERRGGCTAPAHKSKQQPFQGHRLCAARLARIPAKGAVENEKLAKAGRKRSASTKKSRI